MDDKLNMPERISHLLNKIESPVVCEDCCAEYALINKPSFALRDFIEVDVGFTQIGIQIWCRRHNKNVCHVDFAGNKLRADFRALNHLGKDEK